MVLPRFFRPTSLKKFVVERSRSNIEKKQNESQQKSNDNQSMIKREKNKYTDLTMMVH